jgi:hypothetical protein
MIERIKHFFSPSQRWIKKYITYNAYCDKPELIQEFLFGCLLELVEKEEYFEIVEIGHKVDFHAELTGWYRYIKFQRSMQTECDKESLDQKCLEWIVKNRNSFWT